MKQDRIFYFCRINSFSDQKRFGSALHIGPAYQKLLHVVRALSLKGATSIVTVPVCSELKVGATKLGTRIYREKGVMLISLGGVAHRLLSRIYASLSFFLFALRQVSRKDDVVLYNFFPEYVPAAFWLAAVGNRAILDIEDAPRKDERSFVGWITRFSFCVLRVLCRPGCLTVSLQVAKTLKLSHPMIVYGASPLLSEQESRLRSLQNESLGTRPVLRVIFGGNLQAATGLFIFCEFLSLLRNSDIKPAYDLQIIVTGSGGERELDKAISEKLPAWVTLVPYHDLAFDAYEAVLNSCHAALCLKLPNTSIGDTTFPSKIVEILRAKLLLITTPVSDVPLLFSEAQVVQLHAPFAESLVEALEDFVSDPFSYVSVAEAGMHRAAELFGYDKVGERLYQWIKTDSHQDAIR